MRMKRFLNLSAIVFVAVTSALAQSGTAAASARSRLEDPAIEQRADALIKQMTLEEKLGQLTQYSAGTPTGPGTGRSDYKEMIARGLVGSLFNVTDATQLKEFQRIAVEQSRLKIPLVFGLDVIHGYRTVFPVPLGMSATWDPNAIEQAARIAAQESSAVGIRWTFSPMVDIARDARWGRIVEGAGEDPYLGQAIARAYVRGYQGTRLDDPTSVAASVKHYAAYGAAEGGRDYNTVDMSERTLRDVYLPPYHAAADEGALTFMSAFNSLNGIPASANHFTLTEILRDEWKWHGFVVSDWQSIGELLGHGIGLDGPTVARKALTAGVDMDMESNLYPQLVPLVKSGAIPMEVVDEAVRRVLRVKIAMGLFEHPYTDGTLQPNAPPTAANLEVARKIAEESFVLLKNQEDRGSVLPLGSNTKTIALIGPLADSAGDMLGSWAGKGDPKDAVTLRTALSQRSGLKLLYQKGTETRTDSESGFNAALQAARQADVILYAAGEDAGWMTGEAASRAELGLPGNQEKLLEALVATGKPVVLIVFSGRPLALPWAAAHVPAILEAWFPGVQAGPALTRVLFGDVSPSGKLTTSFPYTVGQEPLYYSQFPTGRPPRNIDLTKPPSVSEQKYVSRYIDAPNKALFPFGFGLSYSKFQYSGVTLSASSVGASALNSGGTQLQVSADVKNVGSRPADEIVEMYISERGCSVERPIKELKGFQRLTLQPGESKHLQFTLGRDELAFWNADMKFTTEPAQVTVWVGPSSEEGQSAKFTITQ